MQSKVFKHALAALLAFGMSAAAAEELVALGPTPLTNCYTAKELYGTDAEFAAEITNSLNYTQLGSFPTEGYTMDDFLALGNETLPWTGGGATVYKVPAFSAKCWNTSVPYNNWATCDGAASPGACVVDWPMFNASWMVIGQLLCKGDYPTPSDGGFSEENPAPGNISLVLTNQCSQYTYQATPGDNASTWYYVMTDEWGEQYAMQSVPDFLPAGQEEWEEYMAGVVLPEGWSLGVKQVEGTETHSIYIAGDACLLVVLLDNLGNRYHQLTYDVPLAEGLLGSMRCDATNAVPLTLLDKLIQAPRAASTTA